MTFRIVEGDSLTVLRGMASGSVNCCVTSPPYWGLRDYGVSGQIGLEKTPEEYVARMVEVFREVRRVLRADGTCWVNLGDSYASGEIGRHDAVQPTANGPTYKSLGASQGTRQHAQLRSGLKPKDLVGIPWRVAFALQADGWWLRSDIIWAKPNPMPESVTDRPTKAHEYLFLMTKSERYFYDAEAIAEPSKGWNGSSFTDERDILLHPNTGRNRWQERKDAGEASRRGFSTNAGSDKGPVGIGSTRNRRTVWTIATQPFSEAHFATFPEALVEPCVLAGCPLPGTVIDPFAGSGTTGVVALKHGREFIGIELNPEYAAMARRRIANDAPLLNEESA